MLTRRILALLVLLSGVALAFAVIRSEAVAPSGIFKGRPFRLGLDLSGGSHLLYKADVSALPSGQVGDSMDALRDVIERRINLFGVAEPIVQTETSTLSGAKEYRLSIELPGITDLSKAETMIGETPYLVFKVQNPLPEKVAPDKKGAVTIGQNPFVDTPLTGKYLKNAVLQFNPTTGEPMVILNFNDDGAKLFEKITTDNVGKVVAIYLDGAPISAPVVREPITTGTAQITGSFTPLEARALVGRLNSGALPVPISLLSTETVGATLGAQAIHAGVHAALIGFLLIAIFLVLWYRLPGLIATLALGIYVALTLALYKLVPVTITAAGIAGFVISIGMAVDANILIFERFREERARGKNESERANLDEAMERGFARAWTSIRDANIASLIIAVILFWFGTALIKGFALTFGLGVIVSLFSAITVTRLFLRALPKRGKSAFGRFLFSSGFHQ